MPRQLLFVCIAVFAAALGLATSLMLQSSPQVALESGTQLPTTRTIPDFTLIGNDGKAFTQNNLKAQWTIVFVGFATCPDVCPTALSTLKSTVQKMGAAGSALQVLFLSVDPERDTPAILDKYVHFFNPQFKAATGRHVELDKLAKAMSFVYQKAAGTSPSTYTVDHSATMILVNPEGKVAAFFTAPQQADTLSRDLLAMMQKKT